MDEEFLTYATLNSQRKILDVIIGELGNGKVFALLEAKLFYLVCLKNIYIVLQG